MGTELVLLLLAAAAMADAGVVCRTSARLPLPLPALSVRAGFGAAYGKRSYVSQAASDCRRPGCRSPRDSRQHGQWLVKTQLAKSRWEVGGERGPRRKARVAGPPVTSRRREQTPSRLVCRPAVVVAVACSQRNGSFRVWPFFFALARGHTPPLAFHEPRLKVQCRQPHSRFSLAQQRGRGTQSDRSRWEMLGFSSATSSTKGFN